MCWAFWWGRGLHHVRGLSGWVGSSLLRAAFWLGRVFCCAARGLFWWGRGLLTGGCAGLSLVGSSTAALGRAFWLGRVSVMRAGFL